MRSRTVTIFSAAGVTNPTNGAALDAQYAMRASAIVTLSGATGSPSGTLNLQGSNAIPQAGCSPAFVPPESSWVTIPGASATVTGNVATMIGPTETCCRWLRFQYVPTSGAGGQLDGQAHIVGWP